MMKLKTSFCSLAMLAAMISTSQAQSVDVSVIGTIKPAACTPVLTDAGVVDYGNISANTLSTTGYTVQPAKNIAMTITCTAPTKIALAAKSMRLNTTPGVTTESAVGVGTSTAGVVYGSHVVGLGSTTAGEKIGGYSLLMKDIKLEGSSADLILSDTDGASWSAGGAQNSMYAVLNPTPRQMSFATTGSVTPVEFTTMTGNISVQAFINNKTDLNIDHAIKLDGQSSIELIYL